MLLLQASALGFGQGNAKAVKRLLRAFGLLVIAGLSFTSPSASAAEVTIVQDTANTSANNWGYGQSFTATLSGVISNVQFAVNVTDTGTFKIYEGAGDSGTLLYSQAVNFVDTVTSTSDFSFQTFSLNSDVEISSGSVYTFFFTADSATLGALFTSSNTYAGGITYFQTFKNGSWTSLGTHDMTFKVVQFANTIPTLTSFSSTIDSTNENVEVELTLAELKTQGDEADSDAGDSVDAFYVKAVSTGSLKIGANSVAATAFNASSNKTIDASRNAYWTPHANGTLAAFTVVAVDNGGAQSSPAVTVHVFVEPNPPTDIQQNEGDELIDPVVTERGLLVGGSVGGTVLNNGEIRDVQIQEGSLLIGGTLSGMIDNRGVIFNVSLDEDTVVTGGFARGLVSSEGTLTDINLLPGTRIEGGEVSGTITGDALGPALVNARIHADTVLTHIIIGEKAEVDSAMGLNETVKFASPDNIPADMVLTDALPSIDSGNPDSMMAVDLDSTVLVDETAITLLQAIQQEHESVGVIAEQDSATGLVTLQAQDQLLTLFPIAVKKVGGNEKQGTSTTDDGDVLIVTTTTGMAVVGYPVLADETALLTEVEGLGLSVTLDDKNNVLFGVGITDSSESTGIKTAPRSTVLKGEVNYSARPHPESTPAAGEEPGIIIMPSAISDFMITAFHVYEDDRGVLQKQQLVSVPLDWFALKNAITQISGVETVRIGTDGVIAVKFEGIESRIIADYSVTRCTCTAQQPASESEHVEFEGAGDLNGDGIGDLRMKFPGDYQQVFYVLE